MTAVALITGAAHGIGRELAIQLAKQGYAIAAIDCDAAGLADLSAQIQAPCAVACADVGDPDTLRSQIQALEQKLGPIDLLIANAGIGFETTSLDYKPHDFNRIIQINFLGLSNSLAAVIPGMIQRKKGHIVGISSLSSLRGMPSMLAYCASKAAVNTLLEGAGTELRPLGIQVTTICPGWIRTKMTANIAHKLSDIMEIPFAVQHILKAIRQKKSFYFFPCRMFWQLLLLRILPQSWQDRILGKMVKRLKPKNSPGAPDCKG